MKNNDDIPSELADMGVKSYVESAVFDSVIDSLEATTDRKQAVSDPRRYAILYLVYDVEEITKEELLTVVDVNADALEEIVKPLLNTNLIARVTGPVDASAEHTYYRITKLGADEIEGDLKNIHGEEHAEKQYNTSESSNK